MLKNILFALICLTFLPNDLNAAVLPKTKNITVAEGISSEADAKSKCPRACNAESGQWSNQWNATSCSCYKVFPKIAKKPIKNDKDSIQICGETCSNNWKLKWKTTDYGQSTCYCIIPWDNN